MSKWLSNILLFVLLLFVVFLAISKPEAIAHFIESVGQGIAAVGNALITIFREVAD